VRPDGVSGVPSLGVVRGLLSSASCLLRNLDVHSSLFSESSDGSFVYALLGFVGHLASPCSYLLRVSLLRHRASFFWAHKVRPDAHSQWPYIIFHSHIPTRTSAPPLLTSLAIICPLFPVAASGSYPVSSPPFQTTFTTQVRYYHQMSATPHNFSFEIIAHVVRTL